MQAQYGGKKWSMLAFVAALVMASTLGWKGTGQGVVWAGASVTSFMIRGVGGLGEWLMIEADLAQDRKLRSIEIAGTRTELLHQDTKHHLALMFDTSGSMPQKQVIADGQRWLNAIREQKDMRVTLMMFAHHIHALCSYCTADEAAEKLRIWRRPNRSWITHTHLHQAIVQGSEQLKLQPWPEYLRGMVVFSDGLDESNRKLKLYRWSDAMGSLKQHRIALYSVLYGRRGDQLAQLAQDSGGAVVTSVDQLIRLRKRRHIFKIHAKTSIPAGPQAVRFIWQSGEYETRLIDLPEIKVSLAAIQNEQPNTASDRPSGNLRQPLMVEEFVWWLLFVIGLLGAMFCGYRSARRGLPAIKAYIIDHLPPFWYRVAKILLRYRREETIESMDAEIADEVGQCLCEMPNRSESSSQHSPSVIARHTRLGPAAEMQNHALDDDICTIPQDCRSRKLRQWVVQIGEQEHVLQPGRCSLGRSRKMDIQIPDLGVSRHHADLVLKDGNLSIIAWPSENGTLLEHRPILIGVETPIDSFSSAHLELGPVEMRLERMS